MKSQATTLLSSSSLSSSSIATMIGNRHQKNIIETSSKKQRQNQQKQQRSILSTMDDNQLNRLHVHGGVQGNVQGEHGVQGGGIIGMNKSRDLKNSKFQKARVNRTKAKVMTMTPSTIATESTSTAPSSYNMTPSNLDVTTTTEATAATAATAATTATQDILARWKKEKLQFNSSNSTNNIVINDVTNTSQLTQQNHNHHTTRIKNKKKHSHTDGTPSSQVKTISNAYSYEESAIHNTQHIHNDGLHKNNNVNDDECEFDNDTYDDDDTNDDDTNDDDDDTMGHSTSIMTTPTTNTALNTVGLDRLFKNRQRIINNHQQNVNDSNHDKSNTNTNTRIQNDNYNQNHHHNINNSPAIDLDQMNNTATDANNNTSSGKRLFSNNSHHHRQQMNTNTNRNTSATLTRLPKNIISNPRGHYHNSTGSSNANHNHNDNNNNIESSTTATTPDVSLITQDTDLMLNLHHDDVDGILDEIDQERALRERQQQQQQQQHQHQHQQQHSHQLYYDRHQTFHHYQYNQQQQYANSPASFDPSISSTSIRQNKKQGSTLLSLNNNGDTNTNTNTNINANTGNNISISIMENKLLQLQSALDKSRSERNDQKDVIRQRDHSIQVVSEQNESLKKQLEIFQSTVTMNSTLLVKQLENLKLQLDVDPNSRPHSQSPQSTDDKGDNTISTMEEALEMMKEITEQNLPSLMEIASTKKKDYISIEKSLKETKGQLDQTNSALRISKQEEENLRVKLANLEHSVNAKESELIEIETLCNEKVQATHDHESRANELLSQAEMTRNKIELEMKALCVERDGFEQCRMAWEGQVQIKSEEMEQAANKIDEDRKEIILLSETLDSNRQEVESRSKELSSFEEDLVELKIDLEKRQQEIDFENTKLEELKSKINEQEENIKLSEEELKTSCALLEREREELGVQQDLLSQQLLHLADERKDFDNERDEFMERINAFEENEAEFVSSKQLFNKKLTRFKCSVKHAKEDAQKKKNEFDRLNKELRMKERDLDGRMNRCIEEEDRIEKLKQSMSEKQLKYEQDFVQIERAINNERTGLNDLMAKRQQEESLINETTNKREVATKALQAINEESSKVRSTLKKKINAAQSELVRLKDTLDNQQRELELTEEKVSAIKYHGIDLHA